VARELVCVHDWGPLFEAKRTEGGEVIDVSFRVCERCKATWYRRVDEPRVVLMRLEEGPDVVGHLLMERQG